MLNGTDLQLFANTFVVHGSCLDKFLRKNAETAVIVSDEKLEVKTQ